MEGNDAAPQGKRDSCGMGREEVERAMAYAHDVGFDEGYECGYEDGYGCGYEDGRSDAVAAGRHQTQDDENSD